MTELRQAALRCTPDETAEFLNRVVGLGLSAEDIGALATSDSLSTPFFVGAALALGAALLVWFLLPESLPAENRQRIVTRSAKRVAWASELKRIVHPHRIATAYSAQPKRRAIC